jgi:nucleoid-associated protein YejK
MNQLTQEQIKTLEDAFASYPKDFPTTSKYASMQGIQEQLEELNGEPGNIFYIEKAYTLDENIPGEQLHCSIVKMKVGEQNESN